MARIDKNTLFYGDNLTILREHIADESVDLIYLDPPFNSNANYNVLFKSPDGIDSQSQIEAFDDTWHWNDTAERAFDEVMTSGNTDAAEMLRAMRMFLKENDMMAYLAMMAVRMLELHRVLKPTGSLYLHCDPTASHYLKILLDAVFGATNYQNEIVWRRYKRPKGSQHAARRFGRSTDVILFYSKTENHRFNSERVRSILNQSEIDQRYNLRDENGPFMSGPILRSISMGERPNLVYNYKGYTPGPAGWRMNKDNLQALDKAGDLFFTNTGLPRRKVRPTETPSDSIDNLWADIEALTAYSQERLGYPTQKPLALLERILAASSNEGDVVLDPFCGCGTTVHAAQKMNRRWLGIDVTHLAIGLIRRRLVEAFPKVQYEVIGVPKDTGAARLLAETDKYQFQFWALSMIEAVPYKGGRKGADGGVDGYIYFKPDGKLTEKAVVSVKGGANVGVGMIRDLIATIEREKAKVGILLSLEDATSKMRIEASAAGLYKTEMLGDFPRIQILTIDELFEGKKPHLPWVDPTVFRKARREAVVGERKADQGDLGV
jgi:site-specific DNA-methyltransferase (adenine-specific)